MHDLHDEGSGPIDGLDDVMRRARAQRAAYLARMIDRGSEALSRAFGAMAAAVREPAAGAGAKAKEASLAPR